MSNSGIPTTSTLNRIPKIITERKLRDKNGKIVKTKTTIPAHQISSINHTDIVYTQSMKSVPTNIFRNSGSKFSATLEQKSFFKLMSLNIRMTLNFNGEDPDIVPPTYFFDRIEFRSQDGSKHLNIVYNDNMHFALSSLDQFTYKHTKQLMNMTRNDPPHAVSTGGEMTFHLPLMGSWIDTGDLWFKNIAGDVIVDFYPRTHLFKGNPDPNQQIDCISMDFVIQTEELEDRDISTQENFHNSVSSEVTFLDVTPIHFYNQRIQPSTQVKLELDSLRGDYAFLVIYIRAQNTNSVNSLDIGPDGKIDILNPGSQSVLGSGSGIVNNYLKHYIMPQHISSDFLNEHDMIILPFGGSTTKAFYGSKDGSMYFDGSRFYLSLTPGSTFSDAVYDVTIYGYKFASFLNHFGRWSVHDTM